MVKWFYWICLWVCVSSVQAAQYFSLPDNGTLKAAISATELTRIAVDQDRIQVVRGENGSYTLQNDTTQGAVFIQPVEDKKGQSFSIFITTEQGRNYLLLLTPQEKRANMLIIKPKIDKEKMAQDWEESFIPSEGVKQLIHHMAAHTIPPGYIVLKKGHVYQGSHWMGKISQITNQIEEPIQLTEAQFYQPGVKALALLKKELSPGESTLLYQVTAYE